MIASSVVWPNNICFCARTYATHDLRSTIYRDHRNAHCSTVWHSISDHTFWLICPVFVFRNCSYPVRSLLLLANTDTLRRTCLAAWNRCRIAGLKLKNRVCPKKNKKNEIWHSMYKMMKYDNIHWTKHKTYLPRNVTVVKKRIIQLICLV